MKVLVTGGLGFIGHNVIKEFKDHEITCLDNKDLYGSLNAELMQPLFAERRREINNTCTNVTFLNQDITDGGLANKLEVKPQLVIHTASYPRQAEVDLDAIRATKTMIHGLIQTLDAVKDSCERFVFLSSSMVYGDFAPGVTEDAILNPTNLYGIMKLTGEEIVRSFCEDHSINYTIIRPSAVYGERDVPHRLVGKFLTQAMNGETLVVRGPNEELDFTHVSDLAHGIFQASLAQTAVNETFNMTRSNLFDTTILEAAKLALSLAGKGDITIEHRDGRSPSRGRLSITKARNAFDYDPQINLSNGFKLYYDWLVARNH